MIDRALPPLALALAAVAASQLGLEEREEELRRRFVPAVGALDDADRAYRRAIEKTLPRDAAEAMLSAMTSFRARVHDVRDQTRREIGELYRRYGRSYGWFDPLDAYLPPTTGLSHVDGTRVAGFTDNARSVVAALRAEVNAAVAKRLSPAQTEALREAKRHRRDAFERALRAALDDVAAAYPGATRSELDKTLHHLAQLAEGWY